MSPTPLIPWSKPNHASQVVDRLFARRARPPGRWATGPPGPQWPPCRTTGPPGPRGPPLFVSGARRHIVFSVTKIEHTNGVLPSVCSREG